MNEKCKNCKYLVPEKDHKLFGIIQSAIVAQCCRHPSWCAIHYPDTHYCGYFKQKG